MIFISCAFRVRVEWIVNVEGQGNVLCGVTVFSPARRALRRRFAARAEARPCSGGSAVVICASLICGTCRRLQRGATDPDATQRNENGRDATQREGKKTA
jgi:hypothetical protein